MLTILNFRLKELIGKRECLGLKLLLILINYPKALQELILLIYLNVN